MGINNLKKFKDLKPLDKVYKICKGRISLEEIIIYNITLNLNEVKIEGIGVSLPADKSKFIETKFGTDYLYFSDIKPAKTQLKNNILEKTNEVRKEIEAKIDFLNSLEEKLVKLINPYDEDENKEQ